MLKFFKRLSIGKKLQAINLLIVGMITLLTIFILSLYMYNTLRVDYQNNSKTIANLLAKNVASALLFGDNKSAQESLAGLRTVSYVTHGALYDKTGSLFTQYAKQTDTFKALPNFDPHLYQKDTDFKDVTFDRAFPVYSISPDQEQIGTLTLRIDLTDAYNHLGDQVMALLLVGLIGIALVSAALSRLQRNITQPLLSLTQTMRKVSKDGDLSARAIASSQDEIGELARAFNHMVDELLRREYSLHQELKERRRIEAKLSQIAHYDPITHLPNRHSFNSQIDRALLNYKHNQEKFALLYIDLDNFKYVNDTFGHQVGDLLLVRIAERLRASLRKEDFIARLGGDEFMIILNDFTDHSQIRSVAEKVLATLQAPFSLQDKEAFIGASIGITICPDRAKDSETLQRQVDSAMYQAKKLGKNNFQFYQDELSRTQRNRINIEAQLHRALEREEIVVYYQPIIEINSQKIIGFEALVRWVKQDGTIIRPDEFIPLAEEVGLIVDIGEYVLNSASAQMATWVDRYNLDFIAVNFSPRQFKHGDLDSVIFNALKNAQLQAVNFEMEITESVLMDNTISSKNLLEILIRRGVGISIDDFGTGYSSLSYMTSFPISKIKIDLSFIAKLPHDKNALAVVTAIIGLAKSLNLKVVAEGIETPEQLACLTQLNCQYGQGYLFSKPVPAAAATQLLETRIIL